MERRGHRMEGARKAPSVTRVFSVARDQADARRSPQERVSFALDQLGIGRNHPERNRLFGGAVKKLTRAIEESRDQMHLNPDYADFFEGANRPTPVDRARENWEAMVRDGLVPSEMLEEIDSGEWVA